MQSDTTHIYGQPEQKMYNGVTSYAHLKYVNWTTYAGGEKERERERERDRKKGKI